MRPARTFFIVKFIFVFSVTNIIIAQLLLTKVISRLEGFNPPISSLSPYNHHEAQQIPAPETLTQPVYGSVNLTTGANVFEKYTLARPRYWAEQALHRASENSSGADSDVVKAGYLEKFTRFNVKDAKFDFSKFFKSPCILEEVDENSQPYNSNKLIKTEIYKKSKCFKRELQKLRPTYVYVRNVADQSQARYRVRCFPYFMLIGVPKTATSDLAVRLSRHPEIFKSVSKEVYWWNQYRFTINSTLSDYSDFFDTAVMESITNNSELLSYSNAIYGELTTLTLTDFSYWREAVNSTREGPSRIIAHDIKAVLPATKYLVFLRNPVKRLYSQFHMFHRPPKIDPKDGPGMFHRKMVNSIKWWQNCTSFLPVRNCLYGSPPEVLEVEHQLSSWFSDELNHTGCIREGLYALYLQDWLTVFPRTKFLIIKSEDYMQNETRVLTKELFPFLNVRNLTYDESLLMDIKSDKVAESRYLPMQNDTFQILSEFYEPFNNMLATLLQDNKWLW